MDRHKSDSFRAQECMTLRPGVQHNRQRICSTLKSCQDIRLLNLHRIAKFYLGCHRIRRRGATRKDAEYFSKLEQRANARRCNLQVALIVDSTY